MSAVRLFVYGSLKRDAGGTSHPLLAKATYLGATTVCGLLYQVDWYPGLVLSERGVVHGELYEFPAAQAGAMLMALDDYEGGEYPRRKARASGDGFDGVDTWVYVYVGPTHTLKTIASGDFDTPVHPERP